MIPWSAGAATYKVFDEAGVLVADLALGASTAWTVDPAVYDLGVLDAGDKLFFALDSEGSFVGDAAEINWTITRTGDT